MQTMVGIMGPGHASPRIMREAYQLGAIVARSGATLVSGGMQGTMEEACRGAHEAGGLVVGICPGNSSSCLNQYVDVPIVTDMGSGRNYINALTSDILIALGASTPGTLTEVAHGINLYRPLIIVGANPTTIEYIRKFDLHEEARRIVFVESSKEVEAILPDLVESAALTKERECKRYREMLHKGVHLA